MFRSLTDHLNNYSLHSKKGSTLFNNQEFVKVIILNVETDLNMDKNYFVINNCPTRCNNEQSIYLLQGHSTCFGCRRTHHQEYMKL